MTWKTWKATTRTRTSAGMGLERVQPSGHQSASLHVSGLDAHQCGNLFGGRREPDYLDPAPKLACEDNYANGTGDGSILWHLGYQGDFALRNSDGTPDTNLADWFFAQHGPSFVSSNTTGEFSLGAF